MKKYFLLFFLFWAANASAQDIVTVVKDTVDQKKDGLILSNGVIIWEGSQIKCGRGTLPNGDFKYIHTSPTSWVSMASMSPSPNNSAYTPIGRQYSGLNLDVKKIDKMGSKKRGYKYYLKVGGGNIVNYQCELEDAIAVGEIIFK
ncbi:MAG: hypothetical protein WCG90_08390 [Chitinophagia bacterium]